MLGMSNMVLVFSLLLAAETPKQDAKSDLEMLQGSWAQVSCKVDGEFCSFGRFKRVISRNNISSFRYTYGSPIALNASKVFGKKFLRKIGVLNDGFEQMSSCMFTLDPTKNPKEINIVHILPGDKRETWIQRGIYELQGDELKLCFGRFIFNGDVIGSAVIGESKRPREFDSKEGCLLSLK